MNFFAMAGLCSVGMASALLFSPAAVATNADFASSEAIICVECTSEAAARSLALSKVPQLQCHSTDGRQPEMGEDGSSNMFCSALNKRVLVLSPENNYIYSYVVGYRHGGASPEAFIDSGSLSAQEQSAYTELMQTFRDLAAFYRNFSKIALRTPVANPAPGVSAVPGVSAAPGPDSPYYSEGGCYVNTALNLVNDKAMQRKVYDQLIAQALDAPNSPFGQRYREYLEAKGVKHQLTSAELGITVLGSGFNAAASWTNKTADQLAMTVSFEVSEVEATQSHDNVYFKISDFRFHNGMKSYKGLDGSTKYSTNVPVFVTEIDVEKSVILGEKGLNALQNSQVFNNDCVKKALAKGVNSGHLWAEKRAGGDGFNLMTNRYSVYIPYPITRFCDTWYNLQPGFAPEWLSSTCKSQNQPRDHRKEP